MNHQEMLENYGKWAIHLGEVTFFQTCIACPEQYDAYYEGKMIGYVRLRWGRLTVEYPDVGGRLVYEANIGDSPFQGEFTNEDERYYHLRMIVEFLKNAKHSAEVQGVLC